jgi:extradiol dioxygenase family protein
VLASRYARLTKASTIADGPRSHSNMSLPPFHFAFPVDDLAAARRFYGELLGCSEGRSAEHWVDFDLHGHQIVAHLAPESCRQRSTNPVDGEDVPVPHFGLVLPIVEWERLAKRLETAGVEFVIEPTVRFEGQPGEQATMFLLDPAGNALEFKSMADPANLFAKS